MQAEHTKADEGCGALKAWFGEEAKAEPEQLFSTLHNFILAFQQAISRDLPLSRPAAPPPFIACYTPLPSCYASLTQAHKANRELELRRKKQEQMAKAKAAQAALGPFCRASAPPRQPAACTCSAPSLRRSAAHPQAEKVAAAKQAAKSKSAARTEAAPQRQEAV